MAHSITGLVPTLPPAQYGWRGTVGGRVWGTVGGGGSWCRPVHSSRQAPSLSAYAWTSRTDALLTLPRLALPRLQPCKSRNGFRLLSQNASLPRAQACPAKCPICSRGPALERNRDSVAREKVSPCSKSRAVIVCASGSCRVLNANVVVVRAFDSCRVSGSNPRVVSVVATLTLQSCVLLTRVVCASDSWRVAKLPGSDRSRALTRARNRGGKPPILCRVLPLSCRLLWREIGE